MHESLNGYNDMRGKAAKQLQETADAIYKIPERDLEADMKAAMASVEKTVEQMQESNVGKNLTALAKDVANADYSYEGMKNKLGQATELLDIAAEQASKTGVAAAVRAVAVYDNAKATVEKVAIEAREKLAGDAENDFPSKWDVARIHQNLELAEFGEQEEEAETDRERKDEVQGGRNSEDELWKAQGYEKYWDDDASSWYWYHSINGDTHWAEEANTQAGNGEAQQKELQVAEQSEDEHNRFHDVSTAWEGGWNEVNAAASEATGDQSQRSEWQKVWDDTKQMHYWFKPSSGEYHWITQ